MMYDQAGAWSGSSGMDGKSFAKDGHCHREHRHASRREFFAAASAVCTAATFAMHGDAVAEEGSKLIDTHHHFYPPGLSESLGRLGGSAQNSAPRRSAR